MPPRFTACDPSAPAPRPLHLTLKGGGRLREAQSGGGPGLDAVIRFDLHSAPTDPAPRPSGATLPLQGRVKTRTPVLATRCARALPSHCKKAASNKKGRRSADRRIVKSRTTGAGVTASARFGRGARHALTTLPPQCASGALASRRSVAAFLARL